MKFLAASIIAFLVAGCVTNRNEISIPPKDNPFYFVRNLVEQGPDGADCMLDYLKDGSYDGDIEAIAAVGLEYADYETFPILIKYLDDERPRVRGFAAAVAGHTRNTKFIPRLKELSSDTSKLPDGFFEGSVGDRAQIALDRMDDPRTMRRKEMDSLTAKP